MGGRRKRRGENEVALRASKKEGGGGTKVGRKKRKEEEWATYVVALSYDVGTGEGKRGPYSTCSPPLATQKMLGKPQSPASPTDGRTHTQWAHVLNEWLVWGMERRRKKKECACKHTRATSSDSEWASEKEDYLYYPISIAQRTGSCFLLLCFALLCFACLLLFRPIRTCSWVGFCACVFAPRVLSLFFKRGFIPYPPKAASFSGSFAVHSTEEGSLLFAPIFLLLSAPHRAVGKTSTQKSPTKTRGRKKISSRVASLSLPFRHQATGLPLPFLSLLPFLCSP